MPGYKADARPGCAYPAEPISSAICCCQEEQEYLSQVLKSIERHQLGIGSMVQQILEDVEKRCMMMMGHASTTMQGRPALFAVLLVDVCASLLHQEFYAFKLSIADAINVSHQANSLHA